jgi:hypothetical protein
LRVILEKMVEYAYQNFKLIKKIKGGYYEGEKGLWFYNVRWKRGYNKIGSRYIYTIIREKSGVE